MLRRENVRAMFLAVNMAFGLHLMTIDYYDKTKDLNQTKFVFDRVTTKLTLYILGILL